ncbi:MAG: fumarylacetoacetate hydrolase family protein [bacterium]|nr:fumarylacetoacetate hydrolase family protein [bacterium]
MKQHVSEQTLQSDDHWSFTDGTTLPIGTMYCIGRNYSAHAREMGVEVSDKPLVFIKPPTAYVKSGGVVVLPEWSQNIHHEVELVVVMGSNGVAGIGVGLDLTARDVQAIAKERGEPWAVAKGWRGSAPVSDIVPMSVAGNGPWDIYLTINGEQRQHAYTSLMERTIEELVEYIDNIFALRKGDCIFTGTPEGVARCVAGDVAVARLGVGSSHGAISDLSAISGINANSINVLASLTVSFA